MNNGNKMNDLISRQAAIDAAVQSIKDWDGMFIQDANCRIRDAISELPSAQPEHGRWKKAYADHVSFGERPFYRYCSECCEVTAFPYKFCPNCGASNEVKE